ncbi:MAG TPA: hypothetical protein VD969_22085 [Symbiobacteriaceae bacterium]|nr:hypothetical protein [Symbiobacteriaceae bacterium]
MRGLLLLALLLVAAIQPHAAAAPQTYTDPFAYCAAVGNVDAPDARWAGERVPLVIARGLQKAFRIPGDTVPDHFIRGTHWRCMGGEVYACNVGANIPCMSRAETSRTPTEGMVLYCRENPDSPFIPMYVRDRANIYDWRCMGGAPVIIRKVTDPDARGFLSNIWYQIAPPGLPPGKGL